MMRRGLGRSGPALAALLLLQQGAGAQPLQILESHPAAYSVVEGRTGEYFVRFDRPVDHRGSRLFITRAGRVVESLHPRLEAPPNVLYGAAPLLEPGEYELNWSARSLPEGHVTEGSAAFTVRR